MQLHYQLSPVTGAEDPTIVPSNGNPATGTRGTYPPFQSVVYPMTELVNLIKGAGIVPSDADLTQVLEAVQALIKQAIAAIPATNVPTYTGTKGVAVNGTVAEMAIETLPAAATIALSDSLAALVSGADSSISVQALANAILANAVSAGLGIGLKSVNGSEQIALNLQSIPDNDALIAGDFFPYLNSANGQTYVTSLQAIFTALGSLATAAQTATYISTPNQKQAVQNLTATAAVIVGAGNNYFSAADSSGKVTCTKAGLYSIIADIAMEQNIGYQPTYTQGCGFTAYLQINGQAFAESLTYASMYYYSAGTANLSYTAFLNVGDTIQVFGNAGQGAWPVTSTNFNSAALYITNVV